MTYFMTSSGSAYGPRPQLVLDEPSEQELLESLRFLGSDPGKLKAFNRWQVYTEDFADQIRSFIDATHYDAEIKERIYSHIRVSNNLALDIANAVNVVWKHAAASHVSVEGASESQNAALRALINESGLWRHARSWNREAFLCGPVIAIPVIRNGRLGFDSLLPHFTTTLDNPDDPHGAPLSAAWDVTAPRGPAINPLGSHNLLVGYGQDTRAIVLDGFAWRYYGHDKGSFELLGVEEHGIGEFPGALLDLEVSHGGSRWDCSRHQRLVDATVMVGAIEAILSFVRKAQNKKLLTAIGNTKGLNKGQTLDAEKPLVGQTDNPNELDLTVIDFDISPENHLRHAQWIRETITRSYGGQLGEGSGLEREVRFSHDSLTEQREEQIPFAVDFMRDLLSKAIRTCIVQRHPLFLDLPDPEAVRAGLSIKHPPLARSFASVEEQIKWQNHSLSRGLVRFEDLLRPSMPSASEAELRAHLIGNLESQAEIITMMTTRDQSLASRNNTEVPVSETDAQRHGKTGPQVRDAEDAGDGETEE